MLCWKNILQRASSRPKELSVHVSCSWPAQTIWQGSWRGVTIKVVWGQEQLTRHRGEGLWKLVNCILYISPGQACCKLLVIFQRWAASPVFMVLFTVSVKYETQWAQSLGIKCYWMLVIITFCFIIRTNLPLTHGDLLSQSSVVWLDWEFCGRSWDWVFMDHLVFMLFVWFRQHVLFGIACPRNKKALCGNFPVKEGGRICIWEVCSQSFDLQVRDHHTAPLGTRISSFASLESVNFSILNKWWKEPLQTWSCGDNYEVNVFFPNGNSLDKW